MRSIRESLTQSHFSIREISEAASHHPDALRLDIGQPDMPTPPTVIDAVKQVLDEHNPVYTELWGIEPLRKRIATRETHKNPYEADDILVTTGGTGALFCILDTLLSPGQHVLTNDPAWPPYDMIIAATPGEQVQIPYFRDGELNLPMMREQLPDGTQAIIINTPENPTGRVYTRDELQQLGEFAADNDLYIISDEVYDHLTYGDAKHVSIASLFPERTIIVNSLSKTFAMSGWRLGWCAMKDTELREQVGKVNRATTASPNFVSQHAGLAALRTARDYPDKIRAAYEPRRDLVMERIDDLGWDCVRPDGAIYAFPDTGHDSWRFARQLLKETGVAVVPGEPHGTSSDTNVRICFGSVDADGINEAFDRIQQFVTDHPALR